MYDQGQQLLALLREPGPLNMTQLHQIGKFTMFKAAATCLGTPLNELQGHLRLCLLVDRLHSIKNIWGIGKGRGLCANVSTSFCEGPCERKSASCLTHASVAPPSYILQPCVARVGRQRREPSREHQVISGAMQQARGQSAPEELSEALLPHKKR